MTPPTEGERAAFEAGIKFGTLYHQFAGTPVSPDSADSLARAMEAAVENQPFCTDVSVTIDEERLAAAIGADGGTGDRDRDDETGDPDGDGDAAGPNGDSGAADPDADDVADYVELTGTLYDATVTIRRGGHEVTASMETEEDYPLMHVADVQRPE